MTSKHGLEEVEPEALGDLLDLDLPLPEIGRELADVQILDHLSTRSEEVLDGPDDGLFVFDLADDDHAVGLAELEVLADVLDELAAAVGALDLAVTELVGRGHDLPLSGCGCKRRCRRRSSCRRR
jgi:hypothetical protein